MAPPFLTSELDRGEWLASLPGRFTPGAIACGIYSIGGWMGSRTGLDAVEKRKILPLPGFEPQPSNPQLCRVRYPDSYSAEFI
jgi:hypothetical protein